MRACARARVYTPTLPVRHLPSFPKIPLDLLVSIHSLLVPAGDSNQKSPPSEEKELDSPTEHRVGKRDVDAQINTLVRVGLLERSSLDSVRFVAKYMVTIIYDMILHSKRQDMHKVSAKEFRTSFALFPP